MIQLIEDKEIGRGIVSTRMFKYHTQAKSFFGPDDAWVSIPVWEFEIGSRNGDIPEKIVKQTRKPYEPGDVLAQYETAIGHRYIGRLVL